jgi:hypothetical protein
VCYGLAGPGAGVAAVLKADVSCSAGSPTRSLVIILFEATQLPWIRA